MAIIVLILMVVVIIYLGNSFGDMLTNGVRKGQSIILSQNFAKLGNLKSYSYPEIMETCGAPSTSVLIKDDNGVACYRRTWWSPRYELTIIFEMDNKVRCIEREIHR